MFTPAGRFDSSGSDDTNATGIERVRRVLRNFTALAVRQHLRTEVDAGRALPNLTENELKLVRYIVDGSYDWSAFLANRSSADSRSQAAEQTHGIERASRARRA